jgi:glycosyltransferase involved in cell wall biosynthesis
MIKVSVIVPVYNVSEYIERCWDSIRNQTYKNIEVLFVDDCGTDDSVAKLEGYLAAEDTVDARILHHSRNRGLSAARNTGLEAATGEYVYFLDSDDDVTEDCIESLVSPLTEKKYDFVVGDYSVVGDGGYSPLSSNTGAVETPEEVLRTYVAGE